MKRKKTMRKLSSNERESHNHQHSPGEWTAEDMARRFNDPSRDEWQKPDGVIALFEDTRGRTVLDLGAGAGYFTYKLAEKGANVISADIDQSYLDFIAETARTLGMQGRIAPRLVASDSPGLEEEEVDGVLMVDVCHEMDARDEYFRKLQRGLRKGGKLVILEYPPDRCTDDMPPVEVRVPSDTIVGELRGAGFARLEVNRQLLACHYVLIADK